MFVDATGRPGPRRRLAAARGRSPRGDPPLAAWLARIWMITCPLPSGRNPTCADALRVVREPRRRDLHSTASAAVRRGAIDSLPSRSRSHRARSCARGRRLRPNRSGTKPLVLGRLHLLTQARREIEERLPSASATSVGRATSVATVWEKLRRAEVPTLATPVRSQLDTF